MSEFNSQTICILGRQPALGLAELESLYGAQRVKPAGIAALLDVNAAEINFKRLGGTLKVAKILNVLDTTSWSDCLDYLIKTIPEHLQYLPEGKFKLGISVYGLNVRTDQLNRDVLQIKKMIKDNGRSVRVVPNKELALNSAQVLHNKLTHRGAWELVLVRNYSQTILAQTMFVQDIDAYAARDQARPKRDARVGMLPPKLAQILINLADPAAGSTLLDPFCGTGVVLQEALLAGHSVIGTDLEPRMVEYTAHNLEWFKQNYPELTGSIHLEVGDATSFKWPVFDAVVSEVFLGRPLNSLPSPEQLKEIMGDANTILNKFLINLAPQLSDQTVSLAVPAWQTGKNQFKHLPVLANLTEMGYNYLDLKHVKRDELLYFREDQVVARQLIVLKKK